MNTNFDFQLKTDLQHYIADLLWNAKTHEDADKVIAIWGREAVVVKEMMIAASMDTVTETNIAEIVLEQFRNY